VYQHSIHAPNPMRTRHNQVAVEIVVF